MSPILNIKMAAQKFTIILMHADMTAVKIQSNNIVSNKVKDNTMRALSGKH